MPGGSLKGYYITSDTALLAGSDPSASSIPTALEPCPFEPLNYPFVDYVEGPLPWACYVGCRYGTVSSALEHYVQTAEGLVATPPVEQPASNVFALSTEASSVFNLLISTT